jgi:16S rRNA G966 N2-methylase RsmD
MSEAIKRKIKSIVPEILERIILDKSIWFRVVSVEFKENLLPIHDGKTTIVVKIHTNNRASVAGHFGGLQRNGLLGLNSQFVAGFLDATIFAQTKTHYDFILDIHQIGKQSQQNIIQFKKLRDALADNTIQESSLLVKTMRKYHLEYIELRGGDVIGPDISTLSIMDAALKIVKPKKILDLFSGTGATAMVALLNSDAHVTCVDNLSSKHVMRTLAKFGKRAQIINADIFNMKFQEKYDFVFADPLEHASFDVAQQLSPKISKITKNFVLTHGLTVEKYWHKMVRRELQKSFDKVVSIGHSGIEASLCTNN